METICKAPDRCQISRNALLTLIREEADGAVIYQQLARVEPGDGGLLLRQMGQQGQSRAACLSGIYTLITGARPSLEQAPIRMEPVEQMLRRCYWREMHALAGYEKYRQDREYGRVFSRLALQARENCAGLLRLLLPQKSGSYT